MKYRITLGGKVYEVEVERGEAIVAAEYDAAALKAAPPVPAAPAAAPAAPAPQAAPAAAKADGEVIASPLPGNILSIKVSAGQTVKAGDLLLIIEAMKMENEVLAPRDGTVNEIVVQQGAAVDTGAALVVLG